MGYTVLLKADNGRAVDRPHVYEGKDPPWTLREVIRSARNDFMSESTATSFEVRHDDGTLIVELTRIQLDSDAKQYRVEFVQVSDGQIQWLHTGAKDYITTWSQPLAIALAKEMVPHYPPATGFDLVDVMTDVRLAGWDRSHDR